MENEISAVEFDATFYLRENPDVLRAVQQGLIASAAAHFLQFGQYEGRDPNVFFDTDYYLAENPDVLLAIDAGLIGSAFEHFVRFGFQEGVDRAPSQAFESFDEAAYLAANPDVAEAVEDGVFENGFQHFLQFGVNEERPGSGVDLDDLDPNEGDRFTLTAGDDTFEGTTGNDTFQGRGADLNGFDNLEGGAGDDTLNLFVGANATVAVPNTASVSGIETINITRSATFAGTDPAVDASGFEGATQIWQIDNAGDITGLIDSQTAGFRDADATVDVVYEDDATSASVALDNADSDATPAFGDDLRILGEGLTTVNISGTVAAENAAGDAGNLTVFLANEELQAAGESTITTLNVDIDSNVDFAINGAGALSIETVDASASSGDINFEFGSPTVPADPAFFSAIETLTGGSGDDTLTINGVSGLSTDNLSIDANGGNDTINLTASTAGDPTTVTIELGDGDDTVALAGTNIEATATAANIDDNLISITDFDVSEDVLDLSAYNVTEFFTQNAVNAEVDQSATLFENLTEVASTIGANEAAQFVYDGNVYVYVNDADAAVDGGDLLVELSGTTTLLTDDSVLFA